MLEKFAKALNISFVLIREFEEDPVTVIIENIETNNRIAGHVLSNIIKQLLRQNNRML